MRVESPLYLAQYLMEITKGWSNPIGRGKTNGEFSYLIFHLSVYSLTGTFYGNLTDLVCFFVGENKFCGSKVAKVVS